MGRSLPKRSVRDWERSQLRRYAYRAMERDTMSGEPNVQSVADAAMTRLFADSNTREELVVWATREVDYRMTTD